MSPNGGPGSHRHTHPHTHTYTQHNIIYNISNIKFLIIVCTGCGARDFLRLSEVFAAHAIDSFFDYLFDTY